MHNLLPLSLQFVKVAKLFLKFQLQYHPLVSKLEQFSPIGKALPPPHLMECAHLALNKSLHGKLAIMCHDMRMKHCQCFMGRCIRRMVCLNPCMP